MKIASSFLLLTLVALTGCNSSNTETVSTQNTTSSAPAESAAPTQTELAKPAAGKGNVQGRVLFDDKPAQNISVKLYEKFSTILGPSGKSYEAKTNADGYFVIKDVPPAKYEGLAAKVFDTNAVVFMSGGILKAKSYDVAADKTLFIDDTHLFKSDLKIIAPKAASTVPGKGVEIKWDAYPSAAYYKVNLSADDFKNSPNIYGERVDGTSYKIAKPLAKDEYSVKVEAYNAGDRKLSESAENYKFRVGS